MAYFTKEDIKNHLIKKYDIEKETENLFLEIDRHIKLIIGNLVLDYSADTNLINVEWLRDVFICHKVQNSSHHINISGIKFLHSDSDVLFKYAIEKCKWANNSQEKILYLDNLGLNYIVEFIDKLNKCESCNNKKIDLTVIKKGFSKDLHFYISHSCQPMADYNSTNRINMNIESANLSHIIRKWNLINK